MRSSGLKFSSLTTEESPSREEVQRETDEGSSVEKTSCLSCLPATFTSWEIPKPLPETSSGRHPVDVDSYSVPHGLVKLAKLLVSCAGDSAFAEVQGTTDPLQAQEGTHMENCHASAASHSSIRARLFLSHRCEHGRQTLFKAVGYTLLMK